MIRLARALVRPTSEGIASAKNEVTV